ncbi:putative molybdopterin-guanine dinucleotide biosynthesis adapter protein [Alicyclobacillus contaminans]|uniref:molybdopterin-guanine dinucleotide biosynthesis protein B n=1 Tax=Alicyclobacillus contaminans TaxID=392016 RepID=UPI000427D077|nr:molybdopterin-guanine dinucleotide biosynthesis protein B [Alicyclobacillus contaminans]GMA50357.1 putative molybdopterin-guanine dinucleotide biosynthesis adapter protein [Alicyclobacillus contaminans]
MNNWGIVGSDGPSVTDGGQRGDALAHVCGGPRIVSVVGPQNAGKTTWVERLCRIWRQDGKRVGVLKHDGHVDEGTVWEKPGSDTVRYAEAGAQWTMVAGGGHVLLHHHQDGDSESVERLCARMLAAATALGQPLDVLVVEGFKRSALPKLVPIRRPSDLAWLTEAALTHVRAVLLSAELDEDTRRLAAHGWPVYDEGDAVRLCRDLWEGCPNVG